MNLSRVPGQLRTSIWGNGDPTARHGQILFDSKRYEHRPDPAGIAQAGVWQAQQPAYDLWHQQHSQQATFGDSLSRYPHAAPTEVGAKLPRSLAACFPLINLLDEQKNSSTAARCLSNTRPTSKARSAHAGPHCKSQNLNQCAARHAPTTPAARRTSECRPSSPRRRRCSARLWRAP